MHTPPKTRTKDDANKELKEIELKINDEKLKLYIAVKERENAEAGFVAREQKVKKTESELTEIVAKLDHDIQTKKEEVKELEKSIAESNKKIARGTEDFNAISANIQSLKSLLEEKTLSYESSVREKEMFIKNLDRDIFDKKESVKKIDEEISKMLKTKDIIEKETEKIAKEIDERDKELSKREQELENKKSAIRTYSVRFHKQFEGKLSERIIEETTVT